jgi:hypothetical protein
MSDEKPPVGKSWNRLYALVIGVLVVLIVFFYFFARHFS